MEGVRDGNLNMSLHEAGVYVHLCLVTPQSDGYACLAKHARSQSIVNRQTTLCGQYSYLKGRAVLAYGMGYIRHGLLFLGAGGHSQYDSQ